MRSLFFLSLLAASTAISALPTAEETQPGALSLNILAANGTNNGNATNAGGKGNGGKGAKGGKGKGNGNGNANANGGAKGGNNSTSTAGAGDNGGKGKGKGNGNGNGGAAKGGNNSTATAGAKGKGNGNKGNGGAAKGGNNSTAATGGAAAAAAAANSSEVLPDGRIKADATPEDFNVLASVFKSAVVKGDGLNFSDLIVFPDVPQSLFDQKTNTKAFEVTISDKSVFAPGNDVSKAQTAIRRAELLPSIRSTLNNVSTTGVKTMHFSVRSDATRPLNLQHEYQMAFLETAAFDNNQFILKTGTLIGGNPADDPNTLVLTGNTNAKTPTLFKTAFTPDTWHNFALQMDFDKNTIQTFYSTDNNALQPQGDAVANDLSGNGEYHFGVFKKATEPGTDPNTQGTQEANINEGIIFGGIFMENTSNGQVTLS